MSPAAARTAAAAAVLLAVALLALLAAWAGWRMQASRAALDQPPVHEVATDWRDPLMPTAALVARRGPRAWRIEAAPALPEGPRGGFFGRLVAEVNAATCPQARPLALAAPPREAYARLRSAVRAAGLRLVTDSPATGVLEAETSGPFVMGGGSDVIGRVRAAGRGAVVDLRSISRRAAVDGGSNCRRVARLRAAVAEG